MRCVFVAVAAVLATLTVIKRGRDLVGTTWAPPFLTLSFLTWSTKMCYLLLNIFVWIIFFQFIYFNYKLPQNL